MYMCIPHSPCTLPVAAQCVLDSMLSPARDGHVHLHREGGWLVERTECFTRQVCCFAWEYSFSPLSPPPLIPGPAECCPWALPLCSPCCLAD